MKTSDYKEELLTEIETRLENINSLVKRVDVDLLKQRKSIFDYLYVRAKDNQKNSIKEFDNILYAVNHFTGQVPEYFRLTKTFTSQHSKRIQDAFEHFENEYGEFDFNNQVAVEKSKEFQSFLERTFVSHSAIVNAEELNETFLSVFIQCATTIYECLIGIMNEYSNPNELRQSIYDNFEIILPSLEILKKS